MNVSRHEKEPDDERKLEDELTEEAAHARLQQNRKLDSEEAQDLLFLQVFRKSRDKGKAKE